MLVYVSPFLLLVGFSPSPNMLHDQHNKWQLLSYLQILSVVQKENLTGGPQLGDIPMKSL